MYILVMFPYPSGNGLHIGHYYNYAIVDSYANLMRYKGIEVFQPFGYDAFGLPAENYAKKVGRDPRDVTYENIEAFRKQMERMNTHYQEKFITSDPSYQKWTQWVFTKLKEHDLAYKTKGQVNWCPDCETVLANEQVKDGQCERCGNIVIMKNTEQWYFRITAYKQRLIDNLDRINYPKKTIEQQRHWLENLHDWCVSRQRSWGCPIPVEGETDTLDTFVDSSFYHIRYCDPGNDEELCAKDRFMPVDLYVGGNEHACMHLIYARFIHMFLHDIGVVPTEEPFGRLVHQGMILRAATPGVMSADGRPEKMSKSKGNVVSPDDYDPDVLRLYLMFIGHYFDGGVWDDQNIAGVTRFIGRFRTWMQKEGDDVVDFDTFEKKIIQLTEAFKFNKVVSEFMIFTNTNKNKAVRQEDRDKLINLFRVYAPGFKI